MLSQTFRPSAATRNVVKSYHIRHFELPCNASIVKPYPARPEQSLVFYPRERELVEFADGRQFTRPQAMIMNQYTVRTNRQTANDFLVIIAELQPGVASQLIKMNLYGLMNTDLDAQCVLTSEVSGLMERLRETSHYGTMISHVESYVVHLASAARFDLQPVDRVARYLIENNGSCSLDWLADQSCLSARQFERKFKERLGVGPKTYMRLIRMHESYKMKSLYPHMSWMDTAISCGYHDYQHMVRDYKQFANATPTTLWTEQRQAPENLLGMSETFS